MSVYQIVANQTWIGQEVRNVLYYDVDAVLDASQLQEAADKVRLAWATMMASGALADNWVLHSCGIRLVSTPGLDGIEQSFSSGVLAGVSGIDTLPTQIALLVIGRTGTAKPKQVRTYLAGMTEDWLTDGGVWAAAYLAYAHDWASDISTLVVTGEVLVRVAAQWTAPPGPYVDEFNFINSYTETPVPATQKRRRIGVGI